MGIFVAVFAVIAILANLAGGEDTNSQAPKLKDKQEAKKTPKQGSGGQDTIAKPKLVVSSPSESITVTTGSINVEGKVTPAGSDVTVNGQTITPYDDNGSFKQLYILDMGENILKITATNGSKQVEYSRVVTRKLSEKEIAAKKAEEKAAEAKAAKEAAAKKAAEEAAAKKAAEEASKPSFGDGAYQVGKDIQPGTYRTRESLSGCYYERLSGFSGELNEILANGVTDAPAIIAIKPTDAGFQSQGCGTWTKDLSAITESKTSFREGAYIVGTDIEPGTYRNSGSSGCYYERLSDFTGDMNSIIANGVTDAPAVVTIAPTDAGFQSSDCGTWSKLE
ncbi:MAG TPA: hypothetical protein VFI90_03930 [Rubrobacter sp.]|nr:hypothetical protein [Rubrobacter sp.]